MPLIKSSGLTNRTPPRPRRPQGCKAQAVYLQLLQRRLATVADAKRALVPLSRAYYGRY